MAVGNALNPPAFQSRPRTVHLTVTANHREVAEFYRADLRASVAHALGHPELCARGNAAMYGLVAQMPVRGAVRAAVEKMVEQMHVKSSTEKRGATTAGRATTMERIARQPATTAASPAA